MADFQLISFFSEIKHREKRGRYKNVLISLRVHPDNTFKKQNLSIQQPKYSLHVADPESFLSHHVVDLT